MRDMAEQVASLKQELKEKEIQLSKLGDGLGNTSDSTNERGIRVVPGNVV